MLTTAPELPKLYYSTWGYDFYSEAWMAEANCWMYSMIKFAEANIDLEKDREATPLFELFSGSDYIFMHADPTQWPAAQESFLAQYENAMQSVPLRKKEVISVFPVDPFLSFFTYISTEKPKTPPVFEIYKLIAEGDEVPLDNLKHVKLDPKLYEKGGLFIYGQYFLLHPESHHMFKVSGSQESPYYFKSPDFGLPMLTMNNMRVHAKYDYSKLSDQLEGIWDVKERIAIDLEHKNKSVAIFRKEEVENVLRGKNVAIFKYNKEAYSLLRFHDTLSFEPVVVFDDTVELQDSSTYIYSKKTSIPVVNDIDAIDTMDFDAIVLTCSLNFESEVHFLKRIMRRARAEKMPVISLYDDVLMYTDIFDGSEDNSHFYKIHVQDFSITKADSKKYHQFKPKKTLGIFGTDTVQGKFTTQIYLREALKDKLRVTHFATEPTGTLVGADIGFSRVEDEDEGKRLTIHRMLQKELEIKSDLLITGGQNSMIYSPRDQTHRGNASTKIYHQFQPNYIILTMSVDTSSETVTKTLDYIRELARERGIHSEVLGFAIMGGRKIQGSRWTETYFMDVRDEMIDQAKERIEKLTGISVFSVPEEMDKLMDTVLSAISKSTQPAIQPD
ncbi:DUF1611 domain-containing protein [Fulvivirga sp. M361]|uniref:DUF1611 domain-containing protein n=1 Tax=Fulvivirga sp. M361 TaxID=2594266 RepID=UPI001179F3CB|nr:DUF1611 domain-containing protein [Fulvivirga sp. M361]TRX54826.1 DUF1611 domain-containing protein [Fulvivirga sp. M361]